MSNLSRMTKGPHDGPAQGEAGPFPGRLISDGRTFSVHTYFDVCPESPDGRRVVYTRFTGGVPGRDMKAPASGVVVVADRDGGAAIEVGAFAARAAHSGAYTLWIDNATVAYQDGAMLCLVNVDTGVERRIRGGCQMFDPVQGALFCPGEIFADGEDAFPAGLYRLDLDTGAVRKVIGPEELMELPFFRALSGPPTELWCHAKWSPGATRVAGRVDLQPNRKGIGIFSCRPDGSDVIPFNYFSGARWDKPMHWSFFDDESYYGYDVTDPARPCRRWTLDGEIIETLHEGPGNHACLGPGGDYLVTDSWYNVDPRALMFYRRYDREPVVLAQMPHLPPADVHPALSRDGRRVYFNRTHPEGQGSQVWALELGSLLDPAST